MKKFLIINGHPAKRSFSSFIIESYSKVLKDNKMSFKILNLRDLSFDPLFFDYPNQSLEKDVLKAQKLISWADFIVFVYPIWWGSMPALLKGFFDRVFVSGFAFKYNEDGSIEKLLKGKKARLIATAGSPFFYVFFHKFLLTGSIKYPILKFCGFSSVKCSVFHSIRKNKITEKRLGKIKKRIYSFAKKDCCDGPAENRTRIS